MLNRNTKEYREALRASYIPKGEQVSRIELKDGAGVAYLYTAGDRPYAMVFRGSAGRPEFHHSYRNDEHRRRHVADFFASVRAAQQRKAGRQAERAAWANPLKVGDILYTSWGYDQTNVEFFAVTRVSGRRVWVRQIAADYEESGFMSGKTWPAMPITFVGEETMHVAQPSGAFGVYVKISECRHAWPEDGRARCTTSYA